MRALAALVLAWAAFAGPACADEDPSLDGSIFVPGSDPAGPAAVLLQDMAADAADMQELDFERAQGLGADAAAGACAAGDTACEGRRTGQTKPAPSPDAPGRLDPLLREYTLDAGAAAPDASCTPAGARTRDPIWGTQACRRDKDFAHLDFAVSSGDVFVDAQRSGNVLEMRAGSIGDNYWRTGVFDRAIEFEIASPETFSSFVITHADYDDWLHIAVNGQLAYNGPKGGDRLDVVGGRVCYAAGQCGGYELHTSWHFRPNVDILPLLRPGTNRINARIVVGGGGEFYLRMRATYDEAYLLASAEAATMQRCSSLRSVGCIHREAGRCLYAKGGRCVINAQHYDCPQRAPASEIVSCPMPELCADGKCDPPETDAAGGADFAHATAMLELARQGSTYYDPATQRMFTGVVAKCRDKIAWGARDCCRGDAAGRSQTNAALLVQLGMQAARRRAASAGSKYVYDTLYAGELESSLRAIAGVLPDSAPGSGLFSYYGFEVSFAGGTPVLSFDPVSFAIAIAASVISDLLACTQEERVLGMRTGAGLCAQYADYCRSGGFFGCRTEVEEYCCYNSVLARLIAAQGWPQLGQHFVQDGSCPGFTVDQFERLDFSRIDLSEFIAVVQPAVARPRQQSYRTDGESALRESIRLSRPAVQVEDP